VTVIAAGERTASELESTPIAMVRFVGAGDSSRLVDANTLALELLAVPMEDLAGCGFARGLFQDAPAWQVALAAAVETTSPPVLLRWGTGPPVTFLSVRLQRRSDDSVIASLQDLTDQYRLDTILCGQVSGVILTDTERRITWLSPLTQLTTGVRAKHLIGTHVLSGVHPDDVASHEATTEELLANPGVEVVRSWRSRHPLGKDTWWSMRFTQMYLPDEPAIGGIILKAEIVVDPQDTLGAGGGGQSQMTLDEMLPGGLIMSVAGRISFRSKLAHRMLGDAVVGSDAYQWVGSLATRYRPAVLDLLHSVEIGGPRGVTSAAIERPGQNPLWLRIEAMTALDILRRPVGYVVTLLDISAETEAREGLEQAQKQLWHLANHDALTGLPNRMQFNDCLGRALTRKQRDNQNVALLFCDVDYFKPVNDKQGHQVGDLVLAEVARRLSSVTRATDTVCRIGGDEFGIVCETFVDMEGLERLAARLVDIVAQPVRLGAVTANIGLSIGVAVAGVGSTAEDLLSRSDTALYQAKASGRGRYVIAR
jgi:diguanylate cyclase (GGDEF)-like protein/PAS domain S-box-containing protein